MEALQKSMTLLMNSMLVKREARKWEEEKMKERNGKKKKRIMNLWKSKMKDMRQEPSWKKQDLTGNKDSGVSSQRTRTEKATGLVILTKI